MDKNYKIAGTTYFFKGFGDGFSMFNISKTVGAMSARAPFFLKLYFKIY